MRRKLVCNTKLTSGPRRRGQQAEGHVDLLLGWPRACLLLGWPWALGEARNGQPGDGMSAHTPYRADHERALWLARDKAEPLCEAAAARSVAAPAPKVGKRIFALVFSFAGTLAMSDGLVCITVHLELTSSAMPFTCSCACPRASEVSSQLPMLPSRFARQAHLVM